MSEAAEHSDLTRSEGGPTSRADVDLSLSFAAASLLLVAGGYLYRSLRRRKWRAAGRTIMGEVAKHSDLTRSEGGPSPRADVNLPPSFEDCLIQVGIGPDAVTGQVKIRTALRSRMSNAGASLLLVAGGCLCSGVLHIIGAPEWVQILGLVLPWAVALTPDPWRHRPHICKAERL